MIATKYNNLLLLSNKGEYHPRLFVCVCAHFHSPVKKKPAKSFSLPVTFLIKFYLYIFASTNQVCAHNLRTSFDYMDSNWSSISHLLIFMCAIVLLCSKKQKIPVLTNFCIDRYCCCRTMVSTSSVTDYAFALCLISCQILSCACYLSSFGLIQSGRKVVFLRRFSLFLFHVLSIWWGAALVPAGHLRDVQFPADAAFDPWSVPADRSFVLAKQLVDMHLLSSLVQAVFRRCLATAAGYAQRVVRSASAWNCCVFGPGDCLFLRFFPKTRMEQENCSSSNQVSAVDQRLNSPLSLSALPFIISLPPFSHPSLCLDWSSFLLQNNHGFNTFGD